MNAPVSLFSEAIDVDLFAGGGGASTGVEAATRSPIGIAINHDKVAIAVHTANHPGTQHYQTDIFEVDPQTALRGRRVRYLWASPDCRDHSNAKGDVPRDHGIRSLAWIVLRWASIPVEQRPRAIFLENVQEFQHWGPVHKYGKREGKPQLKKRGKTFKQFVFSLENLGYVVEWRILRASDYGAPTRRRRLYLIARRDGMPIVWPKKTHGAGLEPVRTAGECIDWSLPCPSIFLSKADAKALGYKVQRPLSEKTLWRIAQGLRRFVFESQQPFILKVNHGKWEPRHEGLDEPLSVVTASQRGHALVLPVLQQSGQGERQGQRARSLDLRDSLPTVVACGQRHALAAFMVKHFGDPLRSDGGGGRVVGSSLHDPLGAVTTRDHHSFAAVTLAHFRGTSERHPGCADVHEPMPTVAAGGDKGGVHIGEVRAFLSVYYGNDATNGQSLHDPLRAVTTKDRFGVVQVGLDQPANDASLGIVWLDGVPFQIVDIGFRMLEPHELLRAQFGRFAAGYDLSAAKSKKDKIRLIGNSVCPEVAEAIIRANHYEQEALAA